MTHDEWKRDLRSLREDIAANDARIDETKSDVLGSVGLVIGGVGVLALLAGSAPAAVAVGGAATVGGFLISIASKVARRRRLSELRKERIDLAFKTKLLSAQGIRRTEHSQSIMRKAQSDSDDEPPQAIAQAN